jgi:hypothetical protein
MSYNLRSSEEASPIVNREIYQVRRSARIAAKKEESKPKEEPKSKDRIITEVLTNLHGMKYRY